MSAHLQGGRVDISLVQSSAWTNLAKLLDKCPGKKAMVWGDALAGQVGLIAEYKMLKARDAIKMFPLRPTPLPDADVDHIIFITRPKLHLMDYIAKNVKDNARKFNDKKQYHVVFVPKKSLLCEERLKRLGVFGSINTIEELNCQLFPIDSDVVSMEIPEVFREFNIENDPTYIYQTAQAIIFLQELYGPIPRVWGKGVAAKQVWEVVTRLQREKSSNRDHVNNQISKIDQLILIDRSVDLISPLATQLTYEGLIDEIFGINNSTTYFPTQNFLSNEEQPKAESLSEDKKQVVLNSADKVFADIRDMSFQEVPQKLMKQVTHIAAQKKLAKDDEITVEEMKLYVKKLPQIMLKKKELELHISITECIKQHTDQFEFFDLLKTEQEFLSCFEVDKPSPYIEELMVRGKSFISVLRLICLQSLCCSGLKPKVLEGYKRALVQVYGLKALPAIIKLEKVGLLKAQSSGREYTVLKKTLRLVMEDVNETAPTDICYVHSIYAPLAIRLVEQVTKNGGLKQLHDVLGLLPGPTLDETPIPSSNLPQNNDNPKVVLVFFIGGCTFAEISALRFLSKQQESNVEFVIGTTKLINGNSFLQSIIDG